MQSLHVYDYFCYREWNVEGNFAQNMVSPLLDLTMHEHDDPTRPIVYMGPFWAEEPAGEKVSRTRLAFQGKERFY